MSKLQELNLDGRGVNDTDLVGLSALNNLTKLDLHSAVVSDRGAREICKLSDLTWLAVCGGSLTTIGVKTICGGCSKLRKVDFSQNSLVRDEAVGAIAGMGDIEEVNLSNTGVTSGSLYLWVGARKLRSLALLGCKGVTRESVRKVLDGAGGAFGVRAWEEEGKNFPLDFYEEDEESEEEGEEGEEGEEEEEEGEEEEEEGELGEMQEVEEQGWVGSEDGDGEEGEDGMYFEAEAF